MDVSIDNVKATTDLVRIPFILLEAEKDTYKISHVNQSALELFGYSSTSDLESLSVSNLLNISNGDQLADLKEFLAVTTGNWIYADATKKDGSKLPVGVNVVEIKDGNSLYALAIFRDRTESIKYRKDLEKALAEAQDQRDIADKAREEAIKAKEEAEASLFKEKKLSAQVELLRYIFKGVLAIIILLSVLVLIGWFTGKFEKESLAMFERILLVLTGMLGTAMAGVFDSKRVDNGKA